MIGDVGQARGRGAEGPPEAVRQTDSETLLASFIADVSEPPNKIHTSECFW